MATASKRPFDPSGGEVYHPLALWQRDRHPAEAVEAARQLLVDIATERKRACTALPADHGGARTPPACSSADYTAEHWRLVAGGVAVGEAASLLALARGLLLERAARRLDDSCLDAVLVAFALATRCGSRPERIVASVEMLTLLPAVIGGTSSRTHRARGLAALFRTYRVLRWELSKPAILVPHTIMAPLIEAWVGVEQGAIQRGLPALETDRQTLSVALESWMSVETSETKSQEKARQEDNDIDLGKRSQRPGIQIPPEPAAADDASRLAGGLTPFPGFDPTRLTDSRTVLAKRYEVLKTRLPLAAVPSRAAADSTLAALAIEMPNFAAVIERVADELALGRRLGPLATLRLPPLLLVGPPGIGKTRMARRLASSLGLAFAALALAGTADNRELAGTARGWSSAHPAWPVEQLAQLRSANPLLLVDEIDKAGGSAHNGRPAATLLSMLEPTTAAVYQDECLGGPIDLSHISWILSANTVDDLPAPLLSRLVVLTVLPPEPDQVGPLLDTMARDLAREHGLTDPRLLPVLPQDAQDRLHTGYRAHRDPRRLRAELGRSLAAAARREETDSATSLALN